MTERKDTAQADERDDMTETKTGYKAQEVEPSAQTESEVVTAEAQKALEEDKTSPERATSSTEAVSTSDDSADGQVAEKEPEKAVLVEKGDALSREAAEENEANESDKKDKTAEKKESEETAESLTSTKTVEVSEGAEVKSPEAEARGSQDAQASSDEAQESLAVSDTPKASERPAKSTSSARRIVFLMVLMPLIVAAMAGAGIWHTYSTLYSRPVEMSADKVEIIVTEGTSASQALNLARNAGMTLPRWEVKFLSRLEPELLKRIHVGKFRFERGMTPYDVLKTLSGPALIDQQLRIPEGATIWEVMKVITSGEGIVRKTEGFSDEALMKALGVEGRKSLEGLLAPETYRYGTGTTDLVILKKAIDHQRHILEAAWESRSEDCQAKNAYELLILASIIEKETGERGDRGLVSSVFNNRLSRKMALQTDPTVIYGLGPDWSGRLRRKDLDTPTPWNTYTFVGLPPTPISMPSAASIEAAAHPTKSKFLYFVARGDGTSEFSETLRQHNRAVKHFILEKRTTPLPGSKSPKATGTETSSETSAAKE